MRKLFGLCIERGDTLLVIYADHRAIEALTESIRETESIVLLLSGYCTTAFHNLSLKPIVRQGMLGLACCRGQRKTAIMFFTSSARDLLLLRHGSLALFPSAPLALG